VLADIFLWEITARMAVIAARPMRQSVAMVVGGELASVGGLRKEVPPNELNSTKIERPVDLLVTAAVQTRWDG